jgi:beta-glucuronidase
VPAPRETPSRDCRRLDGLWSFVLDTEGAGRSAQWWRGPLPGGRSMPVPASYNDLVTDIAEREHVGDVWYQREVIVPEGWRGRRVVVRCDAATHQGAVWFGDRLVAEHSGGYTPFEADVTPLVRYGEPVLITIRVNNELTFETIPPGSIETRTDGSRHQRTYHDFFNYAGLHRSVWLYSTPHEYVRDITVLTDLDTASGAGTVRCSVEVEGDGETSLILYDAEGREAARGTGTDCELAVPDVHPWRPGEGYLYRLEVRHGSDVYPLAVGVRTVRVDGARVLINDEPFRFRGFGMHEDSVLHGRAHDDARMVRDFALLQWIGANSFRTSHYPYAEEVLDYADRLGFVVISETPAVGLHMSLGAMGTPGARTFVEGVIDERTRAAHLAAVRELIARDKNHPSVVAWSLANEPDTTDPGARDYFVPVVEQARALDRSRPICFANVAGATPEQDTVADLFDLVCLNRYYGWYADTADLISARVHLAEELRDWNAKFGKPIIMSEFGVDAMPGLHALPAQMWTEEFQIEYLAMTMDVFAESEGVIGEHVWNFADFATPQMIHRVGGNRKGVFTRERQPKAAAHWLRARWTAQQG